MLLTQYAIIMVQFLDGLRKIKLRPAHGYGLFAIRNASGNASFIYQRAYTVHVTDIIMNNMAVFTSSKI